MRDLSRNSGENVGGFELRRTSVLHSSRPRLFSSPRSQQDENLSLGCQRGTHSSSAPRIHTHTHTHAHMHARTHTHMHARTHNFLFTTTLLRRISVGASFCLCV